MPSSSSPRSSPRQQPGLARVLATVPALQNMLNARSTARLATTSRSVRSAVDVVREVDRAFDSHGARHVQDVTDSLRALEKAVRWVVPVLKRISKDLMYTFTADDDEWLVDDDDLPQLVRREREF